MMKIRAFLFVFCFGVLLEKCYNYDLTHAELRNTFKWWAETLGERLFSMGMKITKRNMVAESFEGTNFVEEEGINILRGIASNMRKMMDEKERAVRRIMEAAEALSLDRQPPIDSSSSYDYYNADNLTSIESNATLEQELHDIRAKTKRHWQYKDSEFIEHPNDHFRKLPMVKHPRFEDPVNLNYSIIRVSKSIYYRENDVLNDVRWSEPLDLTFQENYKKDPTLIWQYFASTTGFMRLYPAVKWSEEQYDQTYDYRLRNWYTEAITSPKDIVILLDKSGSMLGVRRAMAKHIINNILDTLADNDYVNIYTFTKFTDPLVDCFNDTLMQAHEENLRLLRESLGKYETEFAGNMTIAFERAFSVLEKYREKRYAENSVGTNCNQAIMVITEGIDYDYKPELFARYNNLRPNEYYRPVRVFTYLIGTEQNDARELQWIACSNMGYYVNINTPSEIREKVLKYVDVFSRPLNLNNVVKPDPVWTGTYIDLADRRLANWLWTKVEGNRQRDIFLDYTKRMIEREEYMYTWEDNILLKKEHDYEIYRTKRNYTYVTTVSLPVYDLRPNRSKVLGAAAVDIPISYIKANLMSYRIGVNGYAFLVTNNGLIMVHPDHRTEFQNIPKPTYNRVDITEVELMNDQRDPRDFHYELLELRKNIVMRNEGYTTLDVKTHIDEMKRVIFSTRHYFYTGVGPFSVVVAIPDKYGLNRIEYKENVLQNIEKKITGLSATTNWTIHPEWLYCKSYSDTVVFENPEEELLSVIRNIRKPGWKWPSNCDETLMNLLINDAKVTQWFEDYPFYEKEIELLKNHSITVIFLATHSGLTRWKEIKPDYPPFHKIHNKAIDEVWYKRAVDYYYVGGPNFVYSVPFESLGFDNTTPVTATSAIFREEQSKQAPISVVGYQFYHSAFYDLFVEITKMCQGHRCKVTCSSEELNCFVLDNNAYIVVSDDLEDAGNFFGDVRPDIMHELVTDGIFKKTQIFDYQAICHIDKKKATEPPSSGTRFGKFFDNLGGIINWFMTTIVYFAKVILGKKKMYQSVKSYTLGYNRLQLNKTVPTPCDHQFWLFTLNRTSYTDTEPDIFLNKECKWPYMAQPIPKSNLILLVVNGLCPKNTTQAYQYTPDPIEIPYNISHPCFIATRNNFYKRPYIKCINRNEKEFQLNSLDPEKYCGKIDSKDLKKPDKKKSD